MFLTKLLLAAVLVMTLAVTSGCSRPMPWNVDNKARTKAEPVSPGPLEGYQSIPGRPDKGPPDKEVARQGLTQEDRELLKALIAKL